MVFTQSVAREWRDGLYTLDARGVFAQTVSSHHSPLEGESARRGRKPDVAPVGGTSKAPATPHRPGEPQGPRGRISPPRQPRLAAWLPRLPLKGGV